MNRQVPPSILEQNSALRTYIRSLALLIPTILIWFFVTVLLVPKLEQLWHDAGLTGSKAQWLIVVSRGFKDSFYFIIVGVVILLSLLEYSWTTWPRYRGIAVTCATLFFHTAVLVGITAIAKLPSSRHHSSNAIDRNA